MKICLISAWGFFFLCFSISGISKNVNGIYEHCDAISINVCSRKAVQNRVANHLSHQINNVNGSYAKHSHSCSNATFLNAYAFAKSDITVGKSAAVIFQDSKRQIVLSFLKRRDRLINGIDTCVAEY